MPQWRFRDYKMRNFFSGYRRNYLHNIIISRRTLLHGASYAKSILGDKVIHSDHVRKTSFRYTSFANVHKTYFETSPWPSDCELYHLCFRDQRSSNNRPTIQRKLMGQNEIDLSLFMIHRAHVARDLPFPNLLNTDTLKSPAIYVRSFTKFSTQLRQHKQKILLKNFMHNVQQESKTRKESLSGKKQYVYGHCEWNNGSNRFR